MMQCAICGITIDSVEKMLEQDWIDSFFDGEDEHGPLCPSCTDTLLYIAPDGEFELKEEYRGKIIFHDHILTHEADYFEEIILGFILN
jgi:hypothetical protein